MTLDRSTATSAHPTTAAEIQTVYELRRDRAQHPSGTFDKGGRWYPAAHETASCCKAIRLPSRAHPYSLLVHCRTKKHITTWFREHCETETEAN